MRKNKCLQGVKVLFLQLFNRFYTTFVENNYNPLIKKGISILARIMKDAHFCTRTDIAFFCPAGIDFKNILDRVAGTY